MVDITGKDLEKREQIRQDLKRSEEMRTEIRAKLARGKDEGLLAAWQDIERLDLAIGRQIRQLTRVP
jgi:hypothetical protein